MTLHRMLGKAASPMSCAALAHAGHFPVLVATRMKGRAGGLVKTLMIFCWQSPFYMEVGQGNA